MNRMSPFEEMTQEQISDYRETLVEKIERGKRLKRLYANDDFIEYFMNYYIKEEAKRLVLMMGDSMNAANDAFRFNINERMIAIARLNQFLREEAAITVQAEKELDMLDHPEKYIREEDPTYDELESE